LGWAFCLENNGNYWSVKDVAVWLNTGCFGQIKNILER
jgi:hypothetical protein